MASVLEVVCICTRRSCLESRTTRRPMETSRETQSIGPIERVETLTTVPSVKTTEPIAKPSRRSLNAETRAVDSLTTLDVFRMHQIFCKYYENHPLEKFTNDLAEKDHVILLRDRTNGVIQGFSTLLRVEMKLGTRDVVGYYSGDTVLEEAYWGSPALGLEFLKFLWRAKLRKPFQPLYWFLISKGYKTYLLMANNFATHFPRYESRTPKKIQDLMDAFYGKKFGEQYHAASGLIVPEGMRCHLKECVAEIDTALLLKPRVAYFQRKNPDWNDGVELACIAEMTLWMPFKYAIKTTFRRKKR
jgi:hypothetical protein